MTSKILSKLAETYPDALKNLQTILGPNYPKVLEFWIYVDTLSEQEREEMWQRYCALDRNVEGSAIDAAWDAAAEVVDEKFEYSAWLAALYVTGGKAVFGYATLELIGDVETKILYNLIMSHKKFLWFRRLTKFLIPWYS